MPDSESSMIAASLARIEEKFNTVDTKIDNLTRDDTRTATTVDKLNTRVAVLEKFMWVSVGLSLASGAVSVTNLLSSLN